MNAIEIARWMKPQQCPYSRCKKRFEEGIVHLSGKYGVDLKWWPDGEFLFHYQDTHGFPHELMIEELTKLINSEMSEEEIGFYNKSIKEGLSAQNK